MKTYTINLHTWLALGWLIAASAFVPACGRAAGEKAADKPRGHTIWIEGESARTKSVKPHPWWYDKVQKGQLSGGEWLHHFDKETEGTAEYRFEAPATAQYNFWVRANPIKNKLSYQLDDATAWTPIAMASATDNINIAADNAPDLRFVAWTQVGQLHLSQGAHTLRLRMQKDGSAEHHGGLDAFVLTTLPFAPAGTQKPGAAGKVAVTTTAGAWPFTYANDPFRDDAALDLRFLNEKVAGEKGFVKLTADGNDFARGDGTPLRFWAAGTTIYRQDDKALTHQARFLAKMGVNMVRMHGAFSPKTGTSINEVNEEELNNAWRLVAAMKKQGIYTTISLYWPGHDRVQDFWGLDGYAKGDQPWGLLFFNDRLKAAYKSWAKAVYTRPNPHTGIALGQDPSVAIIQVQNEDSLFFWTTQAIKEPQMNILATKFGAWLQKKYGSLEKAHAAWQGAAAKGDDFAAGKAGIMQVWEMTQPQQGGKARRVDDQTQFFGELQHAFYREIADYYRKELGCKQLINAANWHTADDVRLGDAERWTYTATDVAAVNRYVGGAHQGPNEGWRIDPGDFFTSQSQTLDPLALPTNLKQVVGHPFIIPESTWVPPVAEQSEGPFLIAAYQSLSGVDAYYWFSADDEGYDLDPYFAYHAFADKTRPLFKWSLHPSIVTQFPAAALLYRQGYLRAGEVVVHEERPLANLWQRRLPIITEGKAYIDPNRKPDVEPGSPVKTVASPLAFLAGRVEVKYGGDPKNNRVADLSQFVDESKKTVTSTTGEITLNYGSGLCTLNAAKAQGATGSLKVAGDIKLRDVTIASGNEYATVLCVPLDDQPLAQSRRVLVQTGTIMRPTGWASQDEERKDKDGKVTRGQKVVSTGTMPWQVVNTDVALTINNPNLTKATQLDPGGYRQGAVGVKAAGGTLQVTLPQNALWVVLE